MRASPYSNWGRMEYGGSLRAHSLFALILPLRVWEAHLSVVGHSHICYAVTHAHRHLNYIRMFSHPFDWLSYSLSLVLLDNILYVATHMRLHAHACVPLSTETFGRLDNAAMALLNKLAGCASASAFVFKDGLVVNASRELSVRLFRGNCVMYTLILYALACGNGNVLCASVNIPAWRN